MRRALVALAAALVLLVAGAGPALAHAHLLSSDPADGTHLDTPPDHATLVFSEPLQGDAAIRVDTAAETEIPTTGPTLTVPLAPLPAGAHTLSYRVTSADGHTVTGALHFSVTESAARSAPATPVPDTAPAGRGGGTPIWPYLVGGVLVLAALVTLAVRRGRR